MKSLLVVGSALAILGLAVACSSSGTTFIPNEGGAEGGSTNTPAGKTATGGECTPSSAGAQACAGNECLQLNQNRQGKAGICTEACDTGTCKFGGQCLDTGALGKVCVIPCTTDAQCIDGFVCTDAGNGSKICLVVAGEPVSPEAGTAAGARCTAGGCSVLSTDPDEVQTACDNFPSASAVCQCTGTNVPASPCVAAQSGNGQYCCP